VTVQPEFIDEAVSLPLVIASGVTCYRTQRTSLGTASHPAETASLTASLFGESPVSLLTWLQSTKLLPSTTDRRVYAYHSAPGFGLCLVLFLHWLNAPDSIATQVRLPLVGLYFFAESDLCELKRTECF
jgi:hypothetical protein